MMCNLHCEAEGLDEGSATLILEADGPGLDGVLVVDIGKDCDDSC